MVKSVTKMSLARLLLLVLLWRMMHWVAAAIAVEIGVHVIQEGVLHGEPRFLVCRGIDPSVVAICSVEHATLVLEETHDVVVPSLAWSPMFPVRQVPCVVLGRRP